MDRQVDKQRQRMSKEEGDASVLIPGRDAMRCALVCLCAKSAHSPAALRCSAVHSLLLPPIGFLYAASLCVAASSTSAHETSSAIAPMRLDDRIDGLRLRLRGG